MYRFLYLSNVTSKGLFLAMTFRHHVDTMLQNAATRSVSIVQNLVLDLPAAHMASLAIATPWEIRLLPPVTSWIGEIILFMTVIILAASIPVISLKLTFIKDIFLQSDIRRLFALLPGFFPKTISDIL